MLKEGLLKENIDGEAITWAYNRLKKKRGKKNLQYLMVHLLMTQHISKFW